MRLLRLHGFCDFRLLINHQPDFITHQDRTNFMTQPDPESQTPPAKILFPLGGAFIALFWPGTNNLKRDKA